MQEKLEKAFYKAAYFTVGKKYYVHGLIISVS